MATDIQIAQQTRVITNTQSIVRQLLDTQAALNAAVATYNAIGLGDDQILADEALAAAKTTRAEYRAAITSATHFQTQYAAGHGTNLEKFSR